MIRHALGWALVLAATFAHPAAGQELDYSSEGGLSEEAITDALADEDLDALDEPVLRDIDAEGLAESTPPDAVPVSLPTGEAASGVTPQAISLPNAEGSVEGMGESFAPILSSGTATFSVPIALPPGRAGVQPSLALSYASTGGNSCVGIGWNLSAPFIARQTDRGLPRYIDDDRWHGDEDRFLYNGGQELIPVDDEDIAAVDDSGHNYGATAVPAEVTGWQQYRARVEGGFMRFFRSPDSRRWVVQSKDGTRFDFGVVTDADAAMAADSVHALQSELSDGRGAVYRWMLTRMSDAHGSTVYYVYDEDQGQRYLRDVYYLSPSACLGEGASVAAVRGCDEPLSRYGVRVALAYENRADVFTSYVTTWRVATARRLSTITVTAAADAVGERFLVRRYHLSYDPSSYHSLLSSVQVEGRPDGLDASAQVQVGAPDTLSESGLGTSIVGRLLPPMRFSYSQQPGAGPQIAGFGGVDATVRAVEASPPHSVDEGRSDLFDVNSDGLPDLLVTDPARYRTADGSPAVGVFFNGFSGSRAVPAGSGGVFSQAVPVGVPAGLSGTLSLASAVIRPMDVDGDGRTDLLHLPRYDRYGYFTPTRSVDDAGAAPSVSPSSQGWSFTYAQVQLPRDDDDPRIDLLRDGQHVRMLDVNNDHLIDAVRTTGTVMQTWLNLGWTPGGEGRFGTASWNGSGWDLSTEPIESCLLHDGLPVDFADPEVRLADLNGDGLQDLVKARRGRVVYWPGRGPGLWGDGAPVCDRGDGDDREIVMASPPAELGIELSNVFFDDVNSDGAADIVQVRFDEVDVWFNRAGASFTERLIVSRTPHAPDFAPRVRIADIDGSATTDIIYGNADAWTYLDLMGGQRPRLLVRVENGLGAVTTLTYGSSVEDYTADLSDAASCASSDCERFTWSRSATDCDAALLELSGECVQRSGGSPVVSTVVRQVQTSDQFGRLRVGSDGVPDDNVLDSRFAYHDGYYEGIEQEFRGFGAADAVALGDMEHPTGWTRTHFHQGRRADALVTDRLADSPFEALKGRTFLTERFDDAGVYLSTEHATCTIRRLATGLDGRGIWYAYVSATDTFLYDTSAFVSSTTHLDLAGVEIEGGETLDHQVPVRAASYARTATTVDEVDNVGNVRQQTSWGRLQDEADPGPAPYAEDIVSHAVPTLIVDGDGGWIWRTAQTQVTGHGSALALGQTTSAFNLRGDLVHSAQAADVASGHEFLGDASGAQGFVQADQTIEVSTARDGWGNTVATCAGADLSLPGAGSMCLRYAEVEYDAAYAQLPETERTAVDASSESYCDAETPLCMLETTAVWDRGLSVVLEVTEPNGFATAVGYDGLGRLAFVRPPDVNGCVGADVPTHRFSYELVPGGLPVSVVYAYVERDCAIGADTLQTRTYVDGLGRARASAVLAQPEHGWIVSGLSELTARGTPHASWQPRPLGVEAPPSIRAAVSLPGAPGDVFVSVPFVRAVYDAFDRTTSSFAEDESETHTAYGALSARVCDPLDLDLGSAFAGTCTVTRHDGHGRVIDVVLHQRLDLADEFHRLWTEYRADGAVTRIIRAETLTPERRQDATVTSSGGRDHRVERTFTYDTVGRRIASTDPDTDSRDGGRTAANRTWRYLFNRVGDLVAVRDPRQCGQNFYYDHAGRLVGEDYVDCAESQSSGDTGFETLPSDAIALDLLGTGGQGVDVSYHYDGLPSWSGDVASPATNRFRGRLAATADRAQRSLVAYDRRGQAIRAYRQMAVAPPSGSVATTLSGELPAVDESDAPTSGSRVYDLETYELRTRYDHGGRVLSMRYPTDPDFDLADPTPETLEVKGVYRYDRLGLLHRTQVHFNGVRQTWVRRRIEYERDGLPRRVVLGDKTLDRTRTRVLHEYDDRRRLTQLRARRDPTTPMSGDLNGVTELHDFHYQWDAANNLTRVVDGRPGEEWPDGHRPQRITVDHDALYRVVNLGYRYRGDSGWQGADDFTDWRADQAPHNAADPMAPDPAPMLPNAPTERVHDLTYAYDWLANMTEWTDGESATPQFYERALGQEIGNGFEDDQRPSALYISSDIPTSGGGTGDLGGWLWVSYGEGGNVETMTVRARCHDDTPSVCTDLSGADHAARRDQLVANCQCDEEQHYQYRWDELNRLSEARRYDRAGTGAWALAVRQRYRYDGANQRMLKETFGDAGGQRVALYVYPGQFERRGLTIDIANDEYDADADTETSYLVDGARVVWKNDDEPAGLDRDHRITLALGDMLGTTSAVIDLLGADVLEYSTYYPNGARENLVAHGSPEFATEPVGFTGKEADEEVGLTYFGERYLIPRVGRWATADPLHVHASGGGEAGNSYHQLAGHLLQTRDPEGLDLDFAVARSLYRDLVAGPSASQSRLVAAGQHMVRRISWELETLFGVATTVTEATWGARLALDTDAARSAVVEDLARGRYESYVRATFREVMPAAHARAEDAAVRDALGRFDAVRDRFRELIGSSDDNRNVELEARDTGSFLVTSGALSVNPFQWFLERNGTIAAFSVSASPGMEVRMGPTFHLLHDGSHLLGCISGSSDCLATSGGTEGEETRSDVDRFTSQYPGVRERLCYHCPMDARSGESVHVARPGSASDAPGAARSRAPSAAELESGVAQ